jgi:hypothetical protein
VASARKQGYSEYLESPAWRARRDAAIARAEGRCQLCNSSRRLNVHHRTYERVDNERDGDLTVLCQKCHERFHGIADGRGRRLVVAGSVPKRKSAKTATRRSTPRHLRPLPGTPPGPNRELHILARTAIDRLESPFTANDVLRTMRKLDRRTTASATTVVRALEWLADQGELRQVGAKSWERAQR